MSDCVSDSKDSDSMFRELDPYADVYSKCLVSDFWAWLLLSLQVRSIMVFMLERIQGKAKKGRLSQER